jgi:hypothetical protein
LFESRNGFYVYGFTLWKAFKIPLFLTMKHRPLSVTLICLLFIVSGLAGIIYHASELKNISAQKEEIWILVLRILAIVGGLFALRGANWARWLLLVWIVYHVILSFSHSTVELIMHVILAILVVIALFHKKANLFFQRK